MSDLSFSIGVLNEDAGTVPVRLTVNGKDYSRDVNAAFSPSALRTAEAYDAAETLRRVAEVSLGVINKINLGVLEDDATIAAQAAQEPPVVPEEDA